VFIVPRFKPPSTEEHIVQSITDVTTTSRLNSTLS